MTFHPIYRTVIFCANVLFRELFDGDVFGDENIPRHGACIIACNHLSFFDPPFIGGAVRHREVYSMARSSLFRTNFRNWLFRGMNCIPVHRDGGDIAAIKSALNLLREQKCIMIFPEGTRSADGTPGTAHAGVGLLAYKSGAPVIPCRISGTFEVMPKGSNLPDWTKKSSIVFGNPILSSDLTVNDEIRGKYELLAQKVMAEILNLTVSVPYL